jgi:hypothetical protein
MNEKGSLLFVLDGIPTQRNNPKSSVEAFRIIINWEEKRKEGGKKREKIEED